MGWVLVLLGSVTQSSASSCNLVIIELLIILPLISRCLIIKVPIDINHYYINLAIHKLRLL